MSNTTTFSKHQTACVDSESIILVFKKNMLRKITKLTKSAYVETFDTGTTE